MFLAPKTDQAIAWQPSASLTHLRLRAEILQRIRQFFSERQVLEVETPLLCQTSVTDPFIESIPALFKLQASAEPSIHYLQTSPEYAMKRLIASGSGDIYQVTKAFRQGEVGRFHNPEFSMIEWYRMGFDHYALMDEVNDFLQAVVQTQPAKRQTYQSIFMEYLGIDPQATTVNALQHCAKAHHLQVEANIEDVDTWLNLLMSHCIEPHLGKDQPLFIYNFPKSQAALAKVTGEVASRFEVYLAGVELANGFHELQDAHEQRLRFEKNGAERHRLSLPAMPVDACFLAALHYGLPNCAGVALGLDRLLMYATQSQHIGDVISFDFSRA
ncbi:MAG: elongation factor P--(R)-beta-lysine ligase [Gammaproteobacteria bacterium]|nr:elongation factor P--(R)-beta-lysine ligase [Gammaproteobacteria bacterium]